MDVEAKREARLGSVPDTPVMLFPAICVLANANDQKSWLGIAFEMLSASLLFSDCFFFSLRKNCIVKKLFLLTNSPTVLSGELPFKKGASLSVFLFNYLPPFAFLFELQISLTQCGTCFLVSATDLRPLLLSVRSFCLVADTTGTV